MGYGQFQTLVFWEGGGQERVRMQPKQDLDEEVKRRFWKDLDEMIHDIPHTEKLFLGGDFNGHIEVTFGGYDDVHGGFGFGDRNERGASLLDFVRAFYLDEKGRVLVDEGLIRRRWQTYFLSLLNEEGDMSIVLGDLELFESRCDFGYCRRIRVDEVEWAMRKMSRGKETGPEEIPVEFWKSVGQTGFE
uniref:Uncharacterized protein LOC104222193 n=1 Tax=Nicotiana sylvestris TaxID=4096 RepID=A0A1U7WBT3_NICSY|nr:PREDICTED: uncharacterized protein LOC104222193 [Nicotiana sylvestris]